MRRVCYCAVLFTGWRSTLRIVVCRHAQSATFLFICAHGYPTVQDLRVGVAFLGACPCARHGCGHISEFIQASPGQEFAVATIVITMAAVDNVPAGSHKIARRTTC
jgi:hypothetical protein